jgi:hypothetical protein
LKIFFSGLPEEASFFIHDLKTTRPCGPPLKKRKRFMKLTQLFFLVVAVMVSPIYAVTTSHWSQTNEADFKAGKFHDVVATNLGDLKLSREVKSLMDENPKVGAVYAMAEAPDGTIYVGTGPQGVLLQVREGKVSTVVELGDGIDINSILVDSHGAVLIGSSGEKGKVLKIDHPGEKPHAIFESDGVQYIWAMVQTSDDLLYVATGPNGELFEVKPDGSHSTILKTDDNNFLSMISDGKDLLYIGSDPNGLVYRVNRKTHDSFVLYDAAESEISALALDAQGNLYVGTSEASDQPPPPADAGAKDKSGRPEGGSTGVPIPSNPPKNPTPPAIPNPNPGQPDPLPKLDVLPKDTDAPGDEPGGDKPAPPDQPAPDANAKPADPNAKPNQAPVNTAGTGQPPSAGNAIYKIDPNGFVTEIFRQQCLILSIIERDGVLLVATGSDGLVYQIKPAADETAVIAKVDAKQVTSLLRTHEGQIILGMANVGGLASMGSGYAAEGTYTSDVFDATQTSKFGKIQMHGSLPAGTSLTISSRSGNVKEPGNQSWSKWSEEQSAAEFVQTKSPSARFFQYRFAFSTKVPTASPVVDDVDVAYLMPNLPPQIKSIKVILGSKNAPPQPAPEGEQPAGSPPPIPVGRIQTITWDASDPNNDPLLFSLYYRQGIDTPWILLKDKLKEASYEWDTRSVADGRYQVKVVASDAAANPVGQGKTANRVSDTVLVDNTPPTIGDIKQTVNGNSVTVTLRAVDRTGTIAAVDYSVDSSQDWQAATPSDTMFDSPEAAATLTAAKLSPGPHEIAIRVTDNRGNQAYQSVLVTIDKP